MRQSRFKLKIFAMILCLLFGAGVSAAADKTTAKPTAAKAGKSNKANKATKTGKGRLRLSLMPALCAEQFVETEPHLKLAPPSGSADKNNASTPVLATPPPRLGMQTDWGVVPFVGSALPLPAEPPERSPSATGTATVTSAPFCDLDAGVSYSLSPSTNLNLGYRLPNSVWSGVLGPLGEDTAGDPAGKKVTIGIDIGF